MDLQSLLASLKGQQTPQAGGLLGQGMAGQAAQTMQNRPYQLHVQESQAQGLQPMPYEQFMQQQQPAKPKGWF